MNSPSAQHECDQCWARYRRLDHLRRHQAQHTGQDPAICEFCNSQYLRRSVVFPSLFLWYFFFYILDFIGLFWRLCLHMTRDILRRHYKTCTMRGANPIPQAEPRGRRKKSCNRCSTLKMACDRGRPCQACMSANASCSLAQIQDADEGQLPAMNQMVRNEISAAVPSVSSGSSPSDMALDAAPRPLVTPTMDGSEDFPLEKVSMPFLVNLVSPESQAFPDTFGYMSFPPEYYPKLPPPATRKRRQTHSAIEEEGKPIDVDINDLASHPMEAGVSPNTMAFNEFLSNNLDNGQPNQQFLNKQPQQNLLRSFQIGAQPNWRYSFSSDRSSRDASSKDGSELSGPTVVIERRLNELIMRLTDLYINLPKGHHARASTVGIESAGLFFTKSNLRIFLQTYFHHFYPHCPLLHIPSFDFGTASISLLLVIYLAGAIYSSLQDELILAQNFFDLAEEYIFQDQLFGQLKRGNLDKSASHDSSNALQTMQAAVSIIFLQNWGGNDVARRRIRTERFNRLVSAVRALRWTRARNDLFSQLPQESPSLEDWHVFAANESRLRVLYYIFLLDSSFCIIYNYPPKMALAEITADLPCQEETFAASSALVCFQNVALEKDSRFPSFGRVLELFLQDGISEETQSHVKALTTLHLFIIIQAIHIVLWTAQTTHLSHLSSHTLNNALSRWAAAWNARNCFRTSKQSKRPGFIKNAFDYCWLAKLILRKRSQDTGTAATESMYGDRCIVYEDDNMHQIRDLLRRLGSGVEMN
ncbi:hypothetical protein DL95DRAFT_481807 [Leptodontidium sp. 2 PMI_412]|nr:hypothetical protein DL95DRAFT_481807 [Leptodontidium sp. 2 PMI_412]